jgi:hypothetical protein
MPRKPQPPAQPPPIMWNVYKFAHRREWLGAVEAPDAAAAVEIAAKKFRTAASRLLAVRHK